MTEQQQPSPVRVDPLPVNENWSFEPDVINSPNQPPSGPPPDVPQQQQPQQDAKSRIAQLLDQAYNNDTYSVWIPSLNRELSFRKLTAGHQKELIASLSGQGLTVNSLATATYLILQSLATEQGVVDQLSIAEKALAILTVRLNNINNKVEINTGDTTEYVNFESHLQQAIEQIKKDPWPSKTIEFDQGKVVVKMPSISNEVQHMVQTQAVVEQIKQAIEDSQAQNQTILAQAYINAIAQYVDSITIQDVTVTAQQLTVAEKTGLIERLSKTTADQIVRAIGEVSAPVRIAATFEDQKTSGAINLDTALFVEK